MPRSAHPIRIEPGSERISREVISRGDSGGGRSIAILIFAPLLLAMALGQLASLEEFEESLAGYRVFGGGTWAVAVALPVAQILVALGLLLRRRISPGLARAAAVGGLLVAIFWTALAVQAFARGLSLENCGCFGAYLVQELRWWILLEDAEFLILAGFSAWAVGLRLRRRRRSVATGEPSLADAPDRAL
jgi:Methylamine utilisation protein MauE